MTCPRDSNPPVRVANATQSWQRELVLMVVALVFSGCATTPAPSGGRWVVSTPQAEFYRNGPAQAFRLPQESAIATADASSGPDFQLPRGAVVTMLRREFGYSRIVTDQGIAGYVANEQLTPAPAVAIRAPADLRSPRPPRSRSKPAPVPRQMEDRIDLTDLDLPLPS